MVKQDIVEKISAKLGLTPMLVSEIISLFISAIFSACIRGEKVKLRGFGVFEMVTHKAKNVLNPKGKSYYVPERRVCKFRPGKLLHISTKAVEK